MTVQSQNNKAIYIGLGILLGLALAYIGYSFFETKELKTTVENQKTEIDNLKRSTDSLATQLRSKADRIDDENEIKNANKNDDNVNDGKQLKDAELTAWNQALEANSFKSYMDFVTKDMNNETYNEKAVNKLMELGKSGWLYAGRTSDKLNYSEDQITEVVWRYKSNEDLKRSLPKKGDVVVLKEPLGRRIYSNFSPRTNQNGLWNADLKAYVKEVRMEGPTAVIIEVIYY